MVALPGQLFLNLRSLSAFGSSPTTRPNVVRGETLFIDARQMGSMVSVERVLTDEDIAKVAGIMPGVVMAKWRNEDVSGFCYSAKFEEIEKNSFVQLLVEEQQIQKKANALIRR